MNDAPAGVLRLTVSQFSARLKRLFDRQDAFKRISIVGEVADFKPQPNGNVYFTLKEGHDAVACFAFSSEAQRFPAVANGHAVSATGSLGVWEAKSQYQLRVFEIEPTGFGALAAQIEALRKKLADEGAFEEARKRAVPRFPRRVAVVSARGEGARDFYTTLHERAPNVEVVFIETRVQGFGAEVDIAEAIDRAGRADVDAVVVLRGGGSFQDRLPFNTEPVVRAILRSRHPVVTAIGHTGDHHLADDVADAVFKTPTAAAEHIVASWVRMRDHLASLDQRLTRAAITMVGRLSQRTDAVAGRLQLAGHRYLAVKERALASSLQRLDRQRPDRVVAERRARVAGASGKIDAAFARLMSRKTQGWEQASASLKRAAPQYLASIFRRLERAEDALSGFDPLRPLALGYAIVLRDGKAVRDASTLNAGDLLDARFERGMARTRVESVQHDG
jgi:exodeoxyribonuclease VII large subunit